MRRRAAGYLLIAAFLNMTACAHLPFAVREKTPLMPPAAAPPPPARPREEPRAPAARHRADAAPPDTLRADPANAPILSPDVPPEEKAKLIETAQRDLQRTEELLQSMATRTLSPAEEEKFRTVEDLLKAAREAGSRAEVREATSLAHKAWLLALDLSGR
jgi:hypothetical protein